ncbi:hypothetical protein SAMN04489842_3190 [Natronobacterium texcoconense]|uniref:Uncharacterized protein n=1 Tax=Natronobacterium texcoconense TaxID=1095778 RepID=A0A1H1HZY7_NATTX|nr:hypothetical protein SAMN04489842_3190 [Natronobacterium texcoconense]
MFWCAPVAYGPHDSSTGHSRIESVLLLCLGLVLVGYGVGRLTDTIAYSIPGVVYLVGGAGLLIWGLSLQYRS